MHPMMNLKCYVDITDLVQEERNRYIWQAAELNGIPKLIRLKVLDNEDPKVFKFYKN